MNTTRSQNTYAACLLALVLGIYLAPWIVMGGRANLLQDEPGHSLLGPLRQTAAKLASYPPQAKLCLYLGDSVMYSQEKYANNEHFELHLPNLVATDYRGLPGAKPLAFESFYSAGFKPNDYLLMSHAFLKPGQASGILVLPINMRFFSKNWYLGPAWQNPVLLRFYPLFQGWRNHGYQSSEPGLLALGLAKLDEASGGQHGDDLRGVAFFYAGMLRWLLSPDPNTDHDMASDLKRNYLDPVGPQHPMLQALVETGLWCQAQGSQPFFYFTPLPVEDIKASCPGQEAILEANIAVVASALQAKGWQARDYHQMFRDGFIKPGIEHLSLANKEILAKKIASDLKDFNAGQ